MAPARPGVARKQAFPAGRRGWQHAVTLPRLATHGDMHYLEGKHLCRDQTTGSQSKQQQQQGQQQQQQKASASAVINPRVAEQAAAAA